MKQRRILLALIGVLLVTLAVCIGCLLWLLLPGSPAPSTPPGTLPTHITTTPPCTTTPTEPTTTQATKPTTLPPKPTEPPTAPPTQPPTEPPTEPTTTPSTEPPLPPEPPAALSLSARQAFVFDLETDAFCCVLGDLDEKMEPASITKLFSAWVALQYLSPDTVLTAGEEVDWIDPESSRAYVYPGHRLTVELCIQGMIIPSGNDAAYVLAVGAGRVIAGDPALDTRAAYDTFVAEMNRQAQALGMTGTHFVNPDGMNEADHYTTMRDLLIMARLALDTPLILEAAQTPRMTALFTSGHYAQWVNSNLLLDPNSAQFYCPEAIGLKTGSTSTAGKCLLAAFRTDGRVLLVCVLGCPNNAARYEDALALYEAFQ